MPWKIAGLHHVVRAIRRAGARGIKGHRRISRPQSSRVHLVLQADIGSRLEVAGRTRHRAIARDLQIPEQGFAQGNRCRTILYKRRQCGRLRHRNALQRLQLPSEHAHIDRRRRSQPQGIGGLRGERVVACVQIVHGKGERGRRRLAQLQRTLEVLHLQQIPVRIGRRRRHSHARRRRERTAIKRTTDRNHRCPVTDHRRIHRHIHRRIREQSQRIHRPRRNRVGTRRHVRPRVGERRRHCLAQLRRPLIELHTRQIPVGIRRRRRNRKRRWGKRTGPVGRTLQRNRRCLIRHHAA